ncbi:hypothetical protein [Halocatena salina]|uniref:Uncharacterized protein n=1 Tax=Halocatena salina TaxID=2934340 RepID=A0A8U0A0U7_9EURY|nr:hypothetical protein [Halocatena salina]UPM41703.1 hypothetical protein MW046_06800 [Halocatena salina]
MVGKSASLLTKTQRQRIRNEFGDLNEEKTHRDQQRIRKRVRSGLFDFQLLSDYPDRQFALLLDDVSEEELRAALADTTIVVERLREQSDIDREDVIEEARTHIEEDSDPRGDTRRRDRIDLRTVAEIRRQTEDELTNRFEPGCWDKRASGLMKLGVSAFILMVLSNLLYHASNNNVLRSILHALLGGVVFLLFVSAAGWVLIKTAQLLKYDIVPFITELVVDPEAVKRKTVAKLIKNPREVARASWEEL